MDNCLIENQQFEQKLEKLHLVGDVVQPTADIFVGHIQMQRLSLTVVNNCREDSLLYLDKLRIQQILINLIQNSIKFSSVNDKITIEVSQARATVDQEVVEYQIRVTDQGIGISDADREKLFQPFFKTKEDKSKERNTVSHGLGLNISKRLANCMGGDLICTDMEEGCQFILKLSLKLVQTESQKSMPVQTRFDKKFGLGMKLKESNKQFNNEES